MRVHTKIYVEVTKKLKFKQKVAIIKSLRNTTLEDKRIKTIFKYRNVFLY